MTATKTFGQLGIKSKNLTGDKIEVAEVIGKPITVVDFRIKPSKYSRVADCLHLQVAINGETRIIFSGSNVLMEDIQKVPEDSFPFTTTIVKIPLKGNEFFLKFT